MKRFILVALVIAVIGLSLFSDVTMSRAAGCQGPCGRRHPVVRAASAVGRAVFHHRRNGCCG